MPLLSAGSQDQLLLVNFLSAIALIITHNSKALLLATELLNLGISTLSCILHLLHFLLLIQFKVVCKCIVHQYHAQRVTHQFRITCALLCMNLETTLMQPVAALPLSGVEAVYGAGFGAGFGRIWLDNVRCTGAERALSDCMAHSNGTNSCMHDQDAGVKCGESTNNLMCLASSDSTLFRMSQWNCQACGWKGIT